MAKMKEHLLDQYEKGKEMNDTMNEWEFACDSCQWIHDEETTCEEVAINA